jgi:hypothetical protein
MTNQTLLSYFSVFFQLFQIDLLAQIAIKKGGFYVQENYVY